LEILDKLKGIENLDEIKSLIREFKTLTEPITEKRRSFFRSSRRIDIIGGKNQKIV